MGFAPYPIGGAVQRNVINRLKPWQTLEEERLIAFPNQKARYRLARQLRWQSEISESPEGDVARQGQPPTVASATERPASPGVATDNRGPLPRIALLQEYKTAIGRPVYPEKTLDALKLRYAAESHYQKDIFSRVTYNLPWVRPTKAEGFLANLHAGSIP